jgi:tagatose 6-phosphate kinase
MSMITTVTLNAAIDKTYYVPAMVNYDVIRVKRMYALPGGKGINVARVVQQLGLPVTVTGIIGGSNGIFIERELTKQLIAHDFVRVDGESRICLNIMDESNGESTEILESGPTISQYDVEAIKQKVQELAQLSRIVTFSGSLPNGAEAGLYAELIQLAKQAGAVVFLDTSGAALVEGIKLIPYLIKPNKEEVAALLGKPVREEGELYPLIHQYMNQGITCVVVTLGSIGSIVGMNGVLYRVLAPNVQAVNSVGSGDSFIAGMAIAVYRGYSDEQCLRFATAAGSANALTNIAGSLDPDELDRLEKRVEVSRISE